MTLRDDVLDKTDIVDLVSKYVQIKKVGKNRSGLCPFHKEKSPSFTVAEDKQIFKCFGCGKGGNAITFHMEIEKIDFRDTMKILSEQAGIDITQYQHNPEKMEKKQQLREKFKLLNKRHQLFLHQAFPNSAAEIYAKEKRILSDETIAIFGLGYAPDSHYDLIHVLKEKGFSGEDILQAGLAKKGSNGDIYAFFRHRLTFPIHDHIGNIVGFGGRALGADQQPKYLNTTETSLYDKSKILFGMHHAREHLREWGLLIVVEGYMDVIALHQYGLPVGIATCGTALTSQHTKLIARHTEYVIFAFDNDSAGFEATIRGLKVAYTQDLFPKILQFPSEYKDVDDRLTARGFISKQQLLEQSIDGFTYILRTFSAQYDLRNPVERKKIMRSCFDVLTTIEDWSILSLYLDQMSVPFGIGADMLLQQFKKFLKKKRTTSFQKIEEPKEEAGIAPKYLLGSLWYDTSLIDAITKHTTPSGKKLQASQVLIEELSTYFPDALIQRITNGSLAEKEQQKLLEAQLWWEHQFGDIADDKKAHVLLTFLQQQLHSLERVILKSKKISDAQKQEIMEKVRELKR